MTIFNEPVPQKPNLNWFFMVNFIISIATRILKVFASKEQRKLWMTPMLRISGNLTMQLSVMVWLLCLGTTLILWRAERALRPK